MRRILCDAVWIYILLLLSSLSCIAPVSSGGSSSETVIGKVVNGDGSPACSTIVTLYPADYDPISDARLKLLTSDTTDANGAYSLKVQDSTVNYSIVATTPKSGVRALISDIILKGDTTRTQDAILSRPGAILIPINNGFDLTNGYVYVPGTNISVFLSGRSDYVILDSVPAGSTLSIHYRAGDGAATTRVLGDSVYVLSNDTVNISYTRWKFSKKLYFNTSSSGADVSGNVYDFPVLIRLTAPSFDFRQAAGNGEDIRFTKTDGSQLPYEIERWDSSGGSAEIWVKIDTVFGNNVNQHIDMYWGDSSATSFSNSAAVFDTSNGFQGVWHLSESGNAKVKDATGNHYDGTPSDTAPVGAEGVIGSCRSFNGSSNFIRMNGTANSTLDFPDNGVYTVSAWVYIDSLDNGSHVIAGKGNEQYFLKFKIANPNIPNSPMVWEFVDYYDKTGYNITNSLPSIPQTRTWSYIVGVRKGTQQFLYLNGALADSTPTLSSLAAPRNTGEDVTIGKYVSAPADTTGGKCPFLGKIDEVRISNAAYNPDWIKLCYKNQKEPDDLVKWK
jgi:hypothetical protein